MAFADHTIHTSGADAIMHEFFGKKRLGPIAGAERDEPNRSTPLVATGSLQLQFLTTGQTAHEYWTDASLRGFTTGHIQSQWYVAMDDIVERYAVGMYCYGSQVNLVSAGNCYLLGCASHLPGPLHPHSVFLAKSAAGLGAFPGTMTLLDVEDSQWVEEATFVLQLTWMATATSVILAGLIGPDSDNLTEVVTYEDMSPLTSPLVEGLWGATDTATELRAFADETAYSDQA